MTAGRPTTRRALRDVAAASRRSYAPPPTAWERWFVVDPHHGGFATLRCAAIDRDVRRRLTARAGRAILDFVADHPVARRHLYAVVAPSLRRGHARQRLTVAESDRVVRVARLACTLRAHYTNWTSTRTFLATRDPRLGGRRPLDLLGTFAGIDLVESLILPSRLDLLGAPRWSATT
jgi:putative toxin-antitoxin system antitoxin component (TIGR02293 family)